MTPLEILESRNILKLSETETGVELLKKTILQARCAYTVQSLLQALNIIPSQEQQQLLCELMWSGMFEVKSDEILEYVESFRKHVNENSVDGVYFDTSKAGNC